MTDSQGAFPPIEESRLSIGHVLADRFEIEAVLGAGGMGVVYRAYDRQTQCATALKTLQRASGQAVYRLKQEFRALSDLHHPNLLRLDDLHVDHGVWFFTMQLVDGVGLRHYVCTGEPGIQPTVRVAATSRATSPTTTHTVLLDEAQSQIDSSPARTRSVDHGFDEERLRRTLAELVEGLHHLHGSGRLHCDVKPSNVMVTHCGQTLLLDLGLTRTLRQDEAPEANRIEGTPAYMAPEQISLEALCPATDLYAVGVILHELMTGWLPFAGSAVQVLAEKLRHPPASLRSSTSALPPDLAGLCDELLAIHPEKRPGAEDVHRRLVSSGTPTLSARVAQAPFVGRQRALERLASFRSAQPAGVALALIEGAAGIGKTTLANHFITWCQERDGCRVLKSRCHEHETLPYNAVDGLVDDLTRRLLLMPGSEVEKVLPADLPALLRVFPVLERVPTIERVRGAGLVPTGELRSRAATALAELLGAFAGDHRLLLLIDDLQWIDEGSVAFLSEFFGDGRVQALLVATQRPSVDAESNPSAALLSEGQCFSGAPLKIELGGLSKREAHALLQAGTGSNLDTETAERLLEDAAGHPLLLGELTRYIVHGGEFSKTSRTNLETALENRIGRLDVRERRALIMVCLAGAPMSFNAVSNACELPTADNAICLRALRGERLVRTASRGAGRPDETFGDRIVEPFHDRIRETVVAWLERTGVDAVPLHRKIGEALLETEDLSRRPEAIFSIADNLGRASPLFVTTGARERLSRLQLLAAERAMQRAAHAQALPYLDRALEGLTAGSALEFEIRLTRMRALHLAGRLDQAGAAFPDLATSASSAKDIGRVYGSKAQLDMNAGRDAEALEAVRTGLSRLGYDFPAAPNKRHTIFEVFRTKFKLRSVDASTLARRPDHDDERVGAIQSLLMAGMHAGFREAPDMMAVCAMRGVQLLASEGACVNAASALVGYALVLAGALSEYEQAAEFGDAARSLCDRYGDDARSTRSIVTLFGSGFVEPWVRPFDECISRLEDGFDRGLQLNDELSAYCCPILAAGLLDSSGASGERIEDLCERSWAANKRRRMDNWALCAEQDVILRRGFADESGDPLAVFEAFEHPLHSTDCLAAALYALNLAQLQLALGSARDGLASIERALELRHQVFASIGTVQLSFVHGAVARRLYDTASGLERVKLARVIRRSAKLMNGWADHCQDNYGGRALLASAEAASISFNRGAARPLYDRALEMASQQENQRLVGHIRESRARYGGDFFDAAAEIQAACEAFAACDDRARIPVLQRWLETMKRD